MHSQLLKIVSAFGHSNRVATLLVPNAHGVISRSSSESFIFDLSFMSSARCSSAPSACHGSASRDVTNELEQHLVLDEGGDFSLIPPLLWSALSSNCLRVERG